MRSQKSIVRKAAKKRANRKDFEKKRNINRNVPTIIHPQVEDVFKSVTSVIRDPKSRKTVHTVKKYLVGTKTKYRKIPVHQNHDGNFRYAKKDEQNREVGMVFYPKTRKYHSKNLKTKSK